MLADLAILRSNAARALFFSAALILVGILLWTRFILPADGRGLTQIFWLLFSNLDVNAAYWTLAILLLAAAVSGVFSGDILLQWISRHMTLIVTTTAAFLSAGSLILYRNHPLAMDEYSVFLQSQIFAAGRLSGHFPVALMDFLVPPGFQNYFLSVSKSTGDVASGYWPSFAILLAPFTAFGAPWACNPVISALTVLVTHRLARRIYNDEGAAALAVLLTIASPELLVNGISYYSMPAHLLANSVFALLLLDPTRNRVILAGLVGSIALTLHNPFPHLLFALPWILWISHRRDGNTLVLWLAAGYLPICIAIGFGWFWFTGHLRQAGMPPVAGGDLASMWWTLSVFALPDGSIMLARAIGIAKIAIWAVPGMLVLAVAGAWRWWDYPAIRLFAASAVLTLLGYLLIPVDQGHGWGYRYFHSAWIALPILSAGALIQSRHKGKGSYFADEDSRAFIVTCAVFMMLIGGAVRAIQVHKFISNDIQQIAGYIGTEPRVILIKFGATFFGGDLVQNDPWLRSDVIHMLSQGREKDEKMMTRYFPELHLVYDDSHATVWSKASDRTGSEKKEPAWQNLPK